MTQPSSTTTFHHDWLQNLHYVKLRLTQIHPTHLSFISRRFQVREWSLLEYILSTTKIFSYKHQQALNVVVTILHLKKMLQNLQNIYKKATKYLEISKCRIRMFTFIHLDFGWKHSNLRLRLYLLWIKVIDKYKMIAKVLWSLIQVNLTLMFYINEIPISSQ